MPDTSSGRRSYMEGPRSRVSFSDIIGRLANGRIAQGIKSGATLAGDVYQGRVDPTSDEGIARSGDMAGLAMMGGIGGAGGTVNSGIKAYHGSPHSFDKFDMSKLGSGEGAQAYGHGLYFAENEGVAKGYRDALSEPGQGHMYEVGIDADPAKFVDYDAPLSPDISSKVADQYRAALAPKMNSDQQTLDIFGPTSPSDLPAPSRYQDLETAFGREEAAKLLKEAGVPGIKYKDAGSRGTGEGTSNYVVFDDRLVSIMKKYGLVGAAGAATAAQIAQELDGKLQANLDAGGA